MSRGRLIFPMLAEVHRLATRATGEVDVNGVGGYDPDFKEPVLIDHDDDGIGERVRREHSPVRIPCQVEPEVFEALQMLASGNAPSSRLALVFHVMDLERLGLADRATGDIHMRVGDRLSAIYDVRGALVQAVRTPPGLFATEVRPGGFGLGRCRNLLFVYFEDRSTGLQRSIA